jgi:hypothetical protein
MIGRLAALPVAALRLDDDVLVLLRRLGLKRLGDLSGIGLLTTLLDPPLEQILQSFPIRIPGHRMPPQDQPLSLSRLKRMFCSASTCCLLGR